MLKIYQSSLSDYKICYNLIDGISGDLNYFKNLGWSLDQFKLQLKKENNLGLLIYNNKILQGFLIGDIIQIEKEIEYEIFLIYIKIESRMLGYATKLLNYIPLIYNNKSLKKIYIEVASNNIPAIDLYKKNNFNQISIRKNYYIIKNKKIDACLYQKKLINE
ncbi:GNAT family N-acetyltransferase [Alphaproteobacteria bacterium]|nr:GNAT family N-acetyltransferase [Alphaproteobacteria bacterium]